MTTNIPSFTLNNGFQMPSVGMGCWMGVPGEDERVYHMCLNAIKAGYRHFDTVLALTNLSSLVGNEKQVGKAIHDSGIPRSEIFLTTKLPNSAHGRVRAAFEQSLKTLDCEYIDLYLMHWPQAGKPDSVEALGGNVFRPEESPTFVETWKDMERLLNGGKVKSIGVSNFSIKTLDVLLPECKVIPAINQVEMHPCLPQHNLKKYCESKGIILTAYSPLGQPIGPDQPISLFNNDTIKAVASKLNVDPAQVLLSWAVQRKTVVIPKTENEARMKSNITLIQLSAEDMKAINELHLQPNMHRTLAFSSYQSAISGEGNIFGWTFEELGWNMVDGFVVSK
ncbi:NADP-dependent oxidoreductase domain-containing protein [Lentinula aciculospora]|uniref:NADP-dependent oxidoreductase domain-containing protein n=1 Tax=Lentinula aciculospora TaxID=153920 RepID=A0A9W9AQM4_9AGAR|nr:NADP-dependent oxidoreductase domain-containing protein [Lentinula aciculospora]